MKYRRGRRGFWWWTWLLVLFVLAGVFGGRMLAERNWSKLPKEYQANAVLTVKARPPLTVSGGTTSIVSVGASELSLIAAIRDKNALTRVAQRLNLTTKWKANTDEIVRLLRAGLETNARGDTGEVGIRATMHSAEDAQNVANMAAAVGTERISEVLEEERGRAMLGLDDEVNALEKEVLESREMLTKALAIKGVNVVLTPKSEIKDLQLYLEDPAVLEPAMEWERARQRMADLETQQKTLRNYWSREMLPPSVIQQAKKPSQPSGPDKGPLLRDGMLYGLILGLVLGLGAMFACWKLLK